MTTDIKERLPHTAEQVLTWANDLRGDGGQALVVEMLESYAALLKVKTEQPVRPVFEVIPMYESGDQWRGKLLGYRIWMKVGGESSVIYSDENKTLCEERAVKFRAMFQSAEAVPEGLIQRVEAALQRIEESRAPRRIPADPTDVDLVLCEVLMLLKGKCILLYYMADSALFDSPMEQQT